MRALRWLKAAAAAAAVMLCVLPLKADAAELIQSPVYGQVYVMDENGVNGLMFTQESDAITQFMRETASDPYFVRYNRFDNVLAKLKATATSSIVLDENGNVVDGDRIMYVCGKYLMEQGKLNRNTIVTTVMSNLGLYKACRREGIRCEQTAVGDKYVSENMTANGYSLGGEQSGHIIFGKHSMTGDGILTSLMVMEVLLEKKRPLSALAGEVSIYPQLLKNVRVADKKAARENPRVQAAVKAVEEALGENGRILVRESGTEPVIRIMVEAQTDEICRNYVEQVAAVMEEEDLVQ